MMNSVSFLGLASQEWGEEGGGEQGVWLKAYAQNNN